jgi:pSer/pThr/pTyr-binding forkhead associated (FHA) protein
MIVKLIVIQGSTTIKEVTLRRTRTVAGRKKGCKLRIRSELVSRIHCSFVCTDTRVSIKDLGSSNGTFVNGVRIAEAALRAGDVVQIGPVRFVVKILEDAVRGSEKTPSGALTDQPADDEVVFFETDEGDQAAAEIRETDLLEEAGEQVEFITEGEGEGQGPVPAEENIFVVDDHPPLDANQVLMPDDDKGEDYRLTDTNKNKPKRRP